jgi:gamma-glutamyltranspeptidase/glutathione hydrolase
MQPQGHVQVIMNMLDFDLNPQAALDAPRWQWISGKTIQVEHEVPIHIVEDLVRRGHTIDIKPKSGYFGQGQIIQRHEDGVLCGATEPRADGAVVGY